MPSDAVAFLTLDEVLAIHERLLARFGGPPGVRDHGLLESALFRPQTGYSADLAEMAGAPCQSLLLNQAVVDGNERIAFFATDVFLRLNGWKLDVRAPEAHRFIVESLEQGATGLERLTAWLRSARVRVD